MHCHRHSTLHPLAALPLLAALALLTSCAGDASKLPAQAFLLSRIEMVLEQTGGVAVGVDLDEHTSVTTDEPGAGCPHDDFTSPEGAPGIDSQLARLGPAITLFDFGDINAILQSFINEGGLSVVCELDDVESLTDDSHVTVRVVRGVGPLALGSNGYAEPGQSFDPDPETPALHGIGRIEDGVLHFAVEGDLRVPLRFLMTRGSIRLRNLSGHMRLEGDPLESASGVLGGAVPWTDIDTLITDALNDTGGDGHPALPLVRQTLGRLADVDRDPQTGACRSLSVGLSVNAVIAFVIGEDAQ